MTRTADDREAKYWAKVAYLATLCLLLHRQHADIE
jgi:hypothetical protein